MQIVELYVYGVVEANLEQFPKMLHISRFPIFIMEFNSLKLHKGHIVPSPFYNR